nr:minichromosome maintenance protein MCM [Ferrimicrobium acidiphilum]
MSVLSSEPDVAFNEFLKTFESGGERKYEERIAQMPQTNLPVLTIDYQDLVMANSDLAVALVRHPDKVLELIHVAIYEILRDRYPQYAAVLDLDDIFVKVAGVDNKVDLRKIGTRNLNEMVYTSGIVTSMTTPGHFITIAAWRCPNGDITSVKQQHPLWLERPVMCSGEDCESKVFRLDLELSKYIDFQKVVLQELPEETPAGEVPRAFNINLFADNINVARPGDRIGVVGVVKAVPEGKEGRVFDTQIYSSYIEQLNKDPQNIYIGEEDKKKMLEITAAPDAYKKLINSVAPAISGHDDEKETILLVLAGSPPTVLPDGTRLRGDPHALFCGDPGTAKSAMLRFASEVAPRSMLVSGTGASRAGLSAAVMKNADGTSVLEAGTMVLADGGIAVVDEAEKMRNEDRVALHEAMEQGTISIQKAGFHVKLNARASVLAAANPNQGRYNPDLSLVDQINFLPSLISRFDLIFVVRDERTKEADERIATHIVELRKKRGYVSAPPVPFELLRKYIAFCKRVNPYPTDAANKKLKEYYLHMRANVPMGGIPPTPRTLESLIRLATCRARVLLRKEVTVEDADAVIRLMERFVYDVATDKTTGKMDFGEAELGVSSSARSETEMFDMAVVELSATSANRQFTREALFAKLEASGKFDDTKVEKFIEKARAVGRLYEPKQGYYARVEG